MAEYGGDARGFLLQAECQIGFDEPVERLGRVSRGLEARRYRIGRTVRELPRRYAVMRL